MAKANILIVEDGRIVAEDIQNSLESLGFSVTAIVPTGEEAVQKAEEGGLDLVLMDIMLKGEMNGTEAAGKIRSEFNIPVVYLTAYSDDDVLARAKLTEPFGYIIKPFEDRELNTAIEIALYKHKMERRLMESEQWLFTTLKSIGDAVIATDTKSHITFMNPVAEALTGCRQEESLGKSLEDIFIIINEASRERVESPVAKVLRAGTIVGLANHTLLVSKDGTEINIDDSGSPIRDEKGNITGVVLVFRDIREKRRLAAERERLQSRLQQAQRLEGLGTLAGGIAHDFNNILAIILGNTELAVDGIPEENPSYWNLEQIKTASLRAKDLIQQILAFSRHSTFEKKPLGLIALITESLKLLRSTIPTFIEIKQDHSCESDTIVADATQINQVFVNLCTNAAYAMGERGGCLDVKMTNLELTERETLQYHDLSPGKYVLLTVSDTGAGIAAENIQRIFEPFYTTKGREKGTGLGLSVAYGIVKQHGGDIKVESRIGKGATFNVLFPVTVEPTEAGATTSDIIQGGNEKILVVDDEQLLTDIAKRILERFGYRVTAMTNSLEALEVFKNNPDEFDLVITDQTMPRMTGEMLARELFKIRADIPIILSTGYSALITDDKIKNLGIKGFIMKPYESRSIAKTIREALDR